MTYSSDSTSAYLTPLGDVLPKPTIVAETTQGPTSTTFSLNPKIAVISSPLVEGLVDIQDDEGSDISSITDTEVREEADNFLETFNATS